VKPIIFNTQMVTAILEGRKTVTRRKVELDLGLADTDKNDKNYLKIPDQYGSCHDAKDLCQFQVGDILYIRETFRENTIGEYSPEGECIWDKEVIEYKASQKDFDKEYGEYVGEYGKWKPSIHMPRKLARIFLKITDIRVERVQDITDKEARREGMNVETNNSGLMHKVLFSKVWNEIYGDWNKNPWVYVIEFTKID
jgi:hypothetical protein